MDYFANTSYFFIPFVFNDGRLFHHLVRSIQASSNWSLVHDEIIYMLKYVADKINSEDEKNCQCFHFALNDYGRNTIDLATPDTWYTTDKHSFRNEKERFRFQILEVQLYCFSTTVCIMAFKIHLEKNDPLWVSAAQYYLKKVSREMIWREDGGSDMSFLGISTKLMEEFIHICNFSFFYYANPSTERANVLTFLEVPPQDDYLIELFHLRRCYHEGFMYVKDEDQDKDEIYMPSQDTVWGISPEAAVCLVCPDHGRSQFLRSVFYTNFNRQYLFMYVLLLHQKYVLYMFLTQIGIGTYNSLETLEQYRHQLYEFETDFVFSCVTEVPQYQQLYDKMVTAFSLKKMYEDVHEPLISLGEIRRDASEIKQRKRDNSINRSLFMLSVLSFFSALVDSFDFVDSFFGLF